MNKINPNDFVTVPQAAKLANMAIPTIWTDIQKHKIEATLIGGRWLMTPSAVADYLARRAAGEFKVGRPRKTGAATNARS
jgi:hypothetical protein